MSLANSLLQSLSVTQDEEHDDTLVIDNNLRTIAIPKSISNLGVEYDDEVLQLNFKMPRYLGTTDLSAFTIRVNYLNANGDGDAYIVKSPEIGSDFIRFTWLVGPTATAYVGNTKFNVCLRLCNSSNVIQKEYNTTIATLPVLEGLETDESIVTRYTDILEQWRRELFGIGDTEEANIRSASETEQENITKKGIEVLATIPEDYQSTYDTANNASRTKASAIVSTVQGEFIRIDDSSNDYLRGMRIFGKTTQISTTGAQLAYTNANIDSVHKGVLARATDDGNVIVSGTSSEEVWNRLATADLVAGEIYTLSSNGSLILTVWDATANTSIATKERNIASLTFKAANTGTHTFILSNPAHSVFASVRADIMVNVGAYAMPWEPYSGGLSAPCPEYPRVMESVADTKCTVYGANLFPLWEVTAVGVTGTPQPDGTVRYTGVADSNAWQAYQVCTLPADGTYTLSVETSNKTEKGSLIQTFDADGLVGRSWQNIEDHFNCTFEGVAGGMVRWNIGVLPDEVVDTYVKLMLNFGEEPLEWKPYAEEQIITLPDMLCGIPVTSGGNYTDANGQQWICDEIDLARGVYVQRIVDFVANDELVYEKSTTVNPNGIVYFTLIHKNRGILLSNDYTPICNNRTIRKDLANMQLNETRVAVNSVGSHMCIWFCSNASTVDEMRSSMGTSESTFLLPLSTPVETPLDVEEIEAFKALYANYPTTTVCNDSGATMEVEYNADTKIWVTNLLEDYKVNSGSANTIVDDATGIKYALKVINGNLVTVAVT